LTIILIKKFLQGRYIIAWIFRGDFMSFIDDFLEINYEVIKKTMFALKNNLSIILLGIPYIAGVMALFSIAGSMGFFAGIVLFVGLSAIASNYLYIIENILTYGKFSREDFQNGFQVYLRKIYILLLIYWFFQFTVNMFLGDIFMFVPFLAFVFMILKFALAVALSALPEVVYQKYFGDFENVTYAFDFFKENWKEWGIPNAILLMVGYFVYYVVGKFMLLFSGLNPTVFAFISFLIFSIAIQAILAFGMIYRGYLFKILSVSSKRKREYMKNMFRH